MQDIADHVGVSKMAVSVALSGTASNVGVSEATRARILDVAQQLHYRPNAIARSLRRRRTNIIGLYSGYGFLDPRNNFLSQIVGGIQEGCLSYRKDLLLHSVYRGQCIEDIYSELVDGRIDGLIMTAPPEDPLAERLAASHLPVVAVAEAFSAFPSVVVDDRQGAHLMLDYLISRGHERLLYRSYNRRLVSAERRKAAYFAVASERGIVLEEWCAPQHTNAEDLAVATLLDRPIQNRPTVVVCWNDASAYDLLAHCHRRGLRVPEDLAVVGFDGECNPLDFRWRLTTIRAPWAEAAQTAVTLLMAQLEGEEVSQETVLPVAFVAGDSA